MNTRSTTEPSRIFEVGAERPTSAWASYWTKLLAQLAERPETRDQMLYAAAEEVRKQPDAFSRPGLPDRPAVLPEKDEEIVALLTAARRGRKLARDASAVMRTFGLWRMAVEHAEQEAIGRLLTLWWALATYERLGLTRHAPPLRAILRESWGAPETVPPEEEREAAAHRICKDDRLLSPMLRRGEVEHEAWREPAELPPEEPPEIPSARRRRR